MTPLQLLSRLKELGLKLYLVNSNIKINDPGKKLTPSLVREIKDKKGEIIEFLKKHAQKREKFVSIYPAEKREYYPLSSAQKRLYIVHQMMEDSIAYNMPSVLELTGRFSREKMAAVVHCLIERHESLRTSFHMKGEEPVQKISSPRDNEFKIEYYENDKSQDPNNKKFLSNFFQKVGRRRQEHLVNQFIRPFDLTQAPLLRVGLIQLPTEDSATIKVSGDDPSVTGSTVPFTSGGDTYYILMLDMHHIISDGTSMGVFTREFLSLYAGEKLSPLRIRYKDYSLWQNSDTQEENIKKQKSFWLARFAGDIPQLNLPTDFPRPVIQSFAGNCMSFELGSENTRFLKTLALEEETTLYIVVLSMYIVLLAKLSGREDIVVGTPTAGRGHDDLRDIIGMFVNTLALLNNVPGDRTFKQFLAGVKEWTLTAFANQDYPYEELVEEIVLERDAARNPLFDTLFVLQNLDLPEVKIPGLAVRPYQDEKIKGTSKFDLSLSSIEKGENLSFLFEYCTELFLEETIQRFTGYFKRIVAAVVKERSIKLRQIEIISEGEKKEILFDFNDTMTPYPWDKTIDRLFTEQVERTPDRVALIVPSDHISLTYRQLNKKSNQLAYIMQQKGIKPGSIAAILADRSLEMITGILAVLKAGGAFLPLDPEYPKARMEYILVDSAAKLLLTQNHYKEVAAGPYETVDLDDPVLYRASNSNPGQRHTSINLSYIMYTSGSTGFPKGVLVEHKNVVRLVMNTNYVELTDETRILQTGAPAFDATTFEIWGALLHGGRLYLVHKNVILDAHQFEHVLKKNRITTLWLGVSLFNQLLQQNNHMFSELDQLLVGGDVLSPKHINLARNKNKKLKVVNGYGPTENTTFSTCYPIEREFENKIPIGKPIANSSAYIFDKYDNLQPIGVPGELWVGGDGVSRGYLNSPELTTEKFTSGGQGAIKGKAHSGKRMAGTKVTELRRAAAKRSPTHVGPWTPAKAFDNLKDGAKRSTTHHSDLLYKTGDLARWLPDGNIEFIGRMDQQVKIRGFRIESGEIESHLLKHDLIKEAVVIDRDTEDDEKYLCAYIVPKNAEPVGANLVSAPGTSTSDLRDYLSHSLPDYMIPSYFVFMESIPLTPNGKIDRQVLPEPTSEAGAGKTYIAPGNALEEKLVEIWSEVLKIKKEEISIDDNFFRIGGHSLKAAITAAKIHEAFDIKVPLEEIFRTSTIRGISSLIKAIKWAIEQNVTIDRETKETEEFIL